jgi:hypothetical protein
MKIVCLPHRPDWHNTAKRNNLSLWSTNNYRSQNAYGCDRMPHEHPAVQKRQRPAHRSVEFRTE